jgi:hypothetical protein
MTLAEVAITLDGKDVSLKCGSEAAKIVNAIAGGMLPAIGRLGALDFDAYVQIVAAGLNKKPRDVEAAVYKTGIVELTKPLITFVEHLTNGGKPVVPVEVKVDET